MRNPCRKPEGAETYLFLLGALHPGSVIQHLYCSQPVGAGTPLRSPTGFQGRNSPSFFQVSGTASLGFGAPSQEAVTGSRPEPGQGPSERHEGWCTGRQATATSGGAGCPPLPTSGLRPSTCCRNGLNQNMTDFEYQEEKHSG